MEGAKGEVESLVEAEPASEVLRQHGVVLLYKGNQLVHLFSLERLLQQLFIDHNEEILRIVHFQLLGEDASGLCQRTVTVPFVHLEELGLDELL